MSIKKFLKEIIITAMLAFVLLNVISYFKKPHLEFEKFPPLNASLIDGSKFSYKDFKDKPFIVHFWATWCPTCKLEISNFDSLSKDYNVITIAVESGSDEEIKKFLDDKKVSIPTINDKNGKLASHFNISGYPTTFVFDKDMKLYFADVGYTSGWSLRLKVWLSGL